MLGKRVIRGVVLVAAIVLIGIGLWQQDFIDVMSKAVRICYECIGIG